MYSTVAAILWFGGLLLMKQHPIIGACLAAAGFVAAGKAMTKPDDMPFFFGLVFWLMAAGLVLAGAINLYRWAF